MAHLVDKSNNRNNLAYIGDTPWHGLGQGLTPDAPIDVWMKEAGFEWEVKRSNVTASAEDGTQIKFLDRYVLYRSDTKAPLGVASSLFKPVQPKEVLEFYRELTAEHGMTLETAGCLKGGALYWALARTGNKIVIKGQDEVKGYCLLATGNDGSMATLAMLSTVRVVCWNTLNLALRGDNQVRVPHHMAFDATAVQAQLGFVGERWAEFEKTAQTLANTKVSREDAVKFFAELLYGEDEVIDIEKPKPALVRLIATHQEGPGQNTRSAKGTAWGLVNAVTRYVDHEKKSFGRETKLRNAWFGDGARLKQAAWIGAQKLAA